MPHPEKAQTVVRLFELYASGRYTLKTLADELQREGHIYRKSQPRFDRTSLSYILNNRFCIGELERDGRVYGGRYPLLIDRKLFDASQRILKGKNRRTGNPEIMLSGGILRCAICGSAITGEQIRRKLADGDRNIHVYYKCGNNHPPEGHPKVRWRERDVETAILEELDSIRIPSPAIAQWLRNALAEAFADATHARTQWRKTLTKRKTEQGSSMRRPSRRRRQS